MGANIISRAKRAVEAKEIEEVVSDYDDEDDRSNGDGSIALHNIDVDVDDDDVTCWGLENEERDSKSVGSGGNTGGGDSDSDAVVDYDEQLLGSGCAMRKEKRIGEQKRRDKKIREKAVVSGRGQVAPSSFEPVGESLPEKNISGATVTEKSDGKNLNNTALYRKMLHVNESEPPSAVSSAGEDFSEVTVATATAMKTPRSKHQPQQLQGVQQHQGQGDATDDQIPPPRTPVRPQTVFSATSLGRGLSFVSSASAAASTPARTGKGKGKWRPSFGSGSVGGAKAGRSPGMMQKPWAVFSTPLRGGGADDLPVLGSMTTSAKRKRGGGAGNGPLGRLLQQVFFRRVAQ